MSRETIFAASVEYFLGPIMPFLRDPAVSEVMVNRHDQIYIEKGGRLTKTDVQFPSEDALQSAVHNVAQWVGRRIDESQPVMDARLPNGSRVHVILPPACRGGTCMTIRKFKPGGLSLADLISYGSLTEAAAEFLRLCVRLHKNMVVSGGTGTGKTSMLNALSTAIPEEERVVVIEDTSELRLTQEHCVYLEVQKPDCAAAGRIVDSPIVRGVAADAAGPDCGRRSAGRRGARYDPSDVVRPHRQLDDRPCQYDSRFLDPLGDAIADVRRGVAGVCGSCPGGGGDPGGGAVEPLFRRRIAAGDADHRSIGFRGRTAVFVAGFVRAADAGPGPARPAAGAA